MLEGANQISAGDIAIVGMALRVPGARNVDEFWRNLRDGVESIRTFSPEELAASGEDPGRVHHPNYVPRGAELPDMEMFDAEFFGLNPKEAAIMDPQHRQFLECAWEAMEDAGRTPTPHAHSGPVGIFAGCGMGSYFFFNVCSNRNLIDQVGMFLLRHTGNDKDFLATRASFTFDLRGPSVNVQTACSTSLVATHYACQSLISGECDMALAGGVTIEFPHRRGYLFQEGEILSPDGHCRAFDHRAAGTVFGSGVGVVVLRRLSDALRDGDVIHGVIKGTAVNNDGNSKAGYLAPSVSGQAEAVLEAQGLAGVAAETIQYVECHGTGTFLGDPIEIEALTAAFRQSTDKTGFCHVGSVKSNIGHLDTAAGVVGLIKAVLAIEHGEIPPTLGFERSNPSIEFDRSPFRVNNKLLKWPPVSGPRRAAVNSLGVGGTNAHAVLEQAPARYIPASETVGSQADGVDPLLLFLSARQRKTLDAMTERLASALSSKSDISLDDVSYTLRHGRRHFDHRMVLAVRNREDAIAALSNAASRGFVHQHVPAQSGTVFLFPGGGVQYVGMAKRLYQQDRQFRSTVDEGLSYLPADVAVQVRETWLVEGSPAAAEAFLRPSLQLPAILIAEIGLARLWMEWGVKPKALIGHSMGENAAACVAGVMSFQDAVHLVHLRGKLFETIRPSGMLSVPIDRQRLAELLPPSLDVASINAPSLCVVSGLNEDLERFRVILAGQGIDATRVPINIAAHSRLVDPILKPFEAFLGSIALRAPTIPILSNRTGLPLSAEEATDPMYWVGHLRSTVHFADGMATLSADPGLIYVEVGPGRVLSSLTKAQGSVPANQVINSLPHPDENTDDRLHFLSAVGRAWAVGVDVDIDRMWEGRSPRRVRLPTYPFQHRRFFIDRAVSANSQQAAELVLSKEPDIERWGYRPAWKRTLADYELGNEKDCRSWLFFLDEGGIGLRLVEQLRSKGHRVVTVSLGDAFVRHDAESYMLCPEFGRAGYDALIAGLTADKSLPTRIVHMWLLTQQETFRPGSNFFHRNQECGFDSLLHLAQALSDAGGTAAVHFTLVSNGMQQVADEALPYPEKATILGPGLVMPKEMAEVTVKVIDVDLLQDGKDVATGFFSRRKGKGSGKETREETTLVEQLWEDFHAKPGSEVVAYRNGRRWTQIHQRMPLREIAAEGTILRRHGVYFVSGGLSEVALALAGELASQFHARLALVGRIALPQREDWDFYERTHGHDNIRRAISAIRTMEEKGAEVLYLQGDVGNPEQMAHAVEASLARFGEINGVFHAAGVVDDGLIQTKTRDHVDRVLTPKVLGTTVLDAVFENVKLDFFLMFSSTSTDVVRAGQVDYVAANAYLNAFAQSRSRRTDRATVALHWGVWNEVGLAARALGLAVDQDHVRPVAGLASGPFFQRWTEDEAGTPWLEATIGPQTEWMLNEHRLVSGQAVMPGTGYIELITQAAREYGLPLHADIEDLVFLKPLVFADGDAKTLRVRLEPVGERFRVIVAAGPAGGGETALFVKHAEAMFTPREAHESRVVDVPALALSFGERRVAVGNETLRTVQENHIRFGPRWAVLQSVAIQKREALAELRLDPLFAEDLAKGTVLHPALLDIATGFALELAEGYSSAASLWAPAAYGRVVLYRSLPAQIISHVRLSDSSDLGDGYAAFDVMITDRQGNLVFEAERFVMRRLESDVALGLSNAEVPAAPHKKHATPSPALLKLGTQVRNGILPAEGFTALLRALGTSEPQPIISSIDLELLQNWVAATAEPAAPTSDNFERPDLDSEFVAPRDPIEETLAGYWRELLGIAKIGIHDSFFDVGGHSLIAVRLFRMIKKEYGLDLPISMLFEAPTIAQCAARIAAERPQGSETVRTETNATELPMAKPLHLVLMNPGRNAEAAPLFICAGMFGNILNLRHLAMCMGADRPVYGLQARGLYGDSEPHITFEEMATDYIAEIRTVQPHGPYLLAGYSGGGIAAYEIARQLVEAGEQVAHVVMLDTPQPRQSELAFRDRVMMKLQDIRRHKMNYLGKYLGDRRRSRAESLAKQEAERQVGATEHFNNEKIEVAFRRAASQYQVKPYAGAVTLFRPKPAVFYRLSGGRCLRENRAILLSDNGWSEHVGTLRVSEVPGDHDSMVLDPYVRVLAERMRAVVADAAANSGARTDTSRARDGERAEPQRVIELA